MGGYFLRPGIQKGVESTGFCGICGSYGTGSRKLVWAKMQILESLWDWWWLIVWILIKSLGQNTEIKWTGGQGKPTNQTNKQKRIFTGLGNLKWPLTLRRAIVLEWWGRKQICLSEAVKEPARSQSVKPRPKTRWEGLSHACALWLCSACPPATPLHGQEVLGLGAKGAYPLEPTCSFQIIFWLSRTPNSLPKRPQAHF